MKLHHVLALAASALAVDHGSTVSLPRAAIPSGCLVCGIYADMREGCSTAGRALISRYVSSMVLTYCKDEHKLTKEIVLLRSRVAAKPHVLPASAICFGVWRFEVETSGYCLGERGL
jgi:hypothetical protein